MFIDIRHLIYGNIPAGGIISERDGFLFSGIAGRVANSLLGSHLDTYAWRDLPADLIKRSEMGMFTLYCWVQGGWCVFGRVRVTLCADVLF